MVQGQGRPASRRRPRSSSATSSPAPPPASCRSSSCARRTGRAASGRSTEGLRHPVRERCSRDLGQLCTAGISALGPDQCRICAGATCSAPWPPTSLASMPTLSELVDLLHGWYPPATADSWDAVGLVAGDPDQDVSKVLFAVDPALPVAQEAAEWGAQLLVVHHPLFLKGVHGVARTTPKGRTLGVLQDAGCALLTAHTNADQAVGGVSEALATTLGLTDLKPIAASSNERLDKLTTYVPVADADRVREALAGAGAGVIGDYDSASFSTPGEGRFRPLAGRQPDHRRGRQRSRWSTRSGSSASWPGTHGRRWSRRCWPRTPTRSRRTTSWSWPTRAWPRRARAGSGRSTRRPWGSSPSGSPSVLPRTAQGVRVAGDPDRVVRTGGGVRGSGRLPARRRTPQRRRRLRDQRPPAPPGQRVPRARRPSAGRCRALGGRVDLAAGGGRRRWPTRWAIRWRPGSARICTDPWNARHSGEER